MSKKQPVKKVVGNVNSFGFFDEPKPLCLGDDSLFKKTQMRVDPTSENPRKVLLDKKQIITSNSKKGSLDDALFSKPDYNALECLYEPTGDIFLRKENDEGWQDAGHTKPFLMPGPH